MKTHIKILLLLTVTIFMFVGVFFGYLLIKAKQEKIFMQANEEAKTLVIDNILRYKANSFLGPVNDYSCWDEMIKYVNRPTREWERVNLTTLEAFGVSYTWIYNRDFQLIFSTYDTSLFNEEVELTKEILLKAFEKEGVAHFFMLVRDTLLEVTGATIVPSDDADHTTEPQGYFFIGKFWDKEYLSQLESEMNFNINFRKTTKLESFNGTNLSTTLVTRPFHDVFGNNIIFVDFIGNNQFVRQLSATNKFSVLLAILFIVTIVVFVWAIRSWVSYPLKRITRCLHTENEEFIMPLRDRSDEFGKFAELISKFFEQKIQLEIEVAERIETQNTVDELYKETVNLNHELQASEEELRQNLDVTLELNIELSKRQKEITDSINYASRIQGALLPKLEILNQENKDFFVLYKPRNIVSGDFYWLRAIDGKFYIAVADCTGHGVPGGFMSMLGMAYLSEVVGQYNDLCASDILGLLRQRVVESLHQTGKIGESKDGMDVALCIIDFEKMKLEFAGAYNPVYIVRESMLSNSIAAPEFIEIKGDRMPIGYSLKMNEPFTNHQLELKKNDLIYLFTDGFQDQICKKTMQKFKRNNLRNLLMGIYHESLEEQKNILDLTFDGYRDDYPQIDDVLVFGIRV